MTPNKSNTKQQIIDKLNMMDDQQLEFVKTTLKIEDDEEAE